MWAKSGHTKRHRGGRRHLRHELASALAWLQTQPAADEQQHNLIAYLVAAHHGKVRLSIRSLPDEIQPPEPTPGESAKRFARGIWDGDELPAVLLPDGNELPVTVLSLECMELGEGSWAERMLALRDAANLGPFRLAYLELLVRVADWTASKKEQEAGYDA